ncbi:PREDICTED: eukaryotic translation initiation factor 4B [Chaetura pelagica]|uniref:eukaryotic translation initiation factor 4B n=1 Tax=Chaetura pelagica TaxID=8897 RepID=UPI00052351B1|nr:PREDICTED: eukaryotic translation initiation factor 4B [Chaetura pelagica]
MVKPPQINTLWPLAARGSRAAVAKKKNKKGKTLTLTDFLAEDGGGGGGPTYIPKPVSWADETDDLEGDVSTTWHSNDDDVYRAPPIDRSLLPTAPRAAREPNIDRSRLPKCPPYTAFVGNLPYDVTEDSIKDFFRGQPSWISAVRLPREPTNPERLKGFGYAEVEDIDSLFQALSLNEESLGNRRIRVDVADQAQDKDRDDRCFGRDRDRYRYRDRYDDRYRDGPRRDMDRGFGGRDRYDDRSRDYDRGGTSWEGHPSWRSEENQERSRTGSESSQTGPPGPPGTSVGTGPTGRTTRRRESEKSLENEPLSREEEAPSPPKAREEKQPLKVMPAPPPKENAWAKRRDENKPDGGSGGRSGSSGRAPGDPDRKESRKDHDARPAPEPKKLDENPPSFSHASKYAALAVDGDDEAEEEEGTE